MKKTPFTAGLLAAGLMAIGCAEQIPGAKASEAPAVTEAREECLATKRCEGADLTAAYLNGADLSQANLRKASLVEANLNGANLTGANLSKADLRGARLEKANLSKANLSGANLSGLIIPVPGYEYRFRTMLKDANLSGADLRKADLSTADMSGSDLSGAYLNGIRWSSETICPNEKTAEGEGFFSSTTCCGKLGTDADGNEIKPITGCHGYY